MASLTVRNIPENVMRKVRQAAKAEKRSVNAQVIQWMEEQAARRPGLEMKHRAKVVDRILALREEIFKRHGMGSDSAKMVRRMRDERAGK